MTTNSISIQDIIEALDSANMLKSTINITSNFPIKKISYSSKSVADGTLFICKGFNFKKEYLNDAILGGICCYMAQEDYKLPKIPAIIVKDVRKAMSIAATRFFNCPQRAFKLTGITGTKGKTTTTFYLKSILDEFLGTKSAVLSTVEMYTGEKTTEAHLTTPESLELQEAFAKVRNNKIQYLTMEVSSQGYKLDRVFGVKFDTGIFMNIDEDHIGPFEHDDFEDYFSSKVQLMANCKTAIICSGTKNFKRIKEVADKNAEKVLIIGANDDDYYVDNITKEETGFSFDVISKAGNKERYYISQEGRFNIQNALCAIVIAKNYGIPYSSIKNGIKEVVIKGRMNVFAKNGVKVIVDYAHNHLSFSEVFQSLKKDYPLAKITVVCGCPGGKAYIRRRDIGTLVGEFADMIYLTEEDPQFEDVTKISNEIAQYIKPFNKPYQIINNRTIAIEKAINSAKNGEIVIVAGKGEEVYQKVRGQYEYYESDLSIAKRMME